MRPAETLDRLGCNGYEMFGNGGGGPIGGGGKVEGRDGGPGSGNVSGGGNIGGGGRLLGNVAGALLL
jgi:hypothetical protein